MIMHNPKDNLQDLGVVIKTILSEQKIKKYNATKNKFSTKAK